jgi:hypothetical protein
MNLRRFALVSCIALLCASGCARSGGAQGTTLRAQQSADESWRASEDTLSLTMRAIATQLGGVGLAPGTETFRGFLTAGARASHALELPPQTCLTLISIASRGVHDMDAALYSADGDVLAVDSQPDAHPTIQVCTGQEPRTLYYALQVYEGAGTFLMAGFVGQQSTLDGAAKLLGSRPAVARLGYSEPDGPGRVSAFRDGLQRRGFQPVQTPLRVPLAAQQHIRSPLAVEPGECYTAAGFALDGLHDVNLRVLDDEGVEVARDASQEEDASAQFCAERRAEYAAELSGAGGEGAALLLLFRVSAASIGGQSGLWLGERPLANASTTPLTQAVAEVSHRAAQDGFRQSRTLHSGQLLPGSVIAQQLSLGARRCARIHAVGGPGLRLLEIVALDAGGRRLAQAEGDAETTYVHVCGATAREITLQAHAEAGSGPFAITVHEAPMASVAPAGTDDTLGAALQQASRRALDAGYHPHAEFKTGPRRISLKSAQPMSIKLQADASRCVRAYVVSSDSGARAELLREGKEVDEPATDGAPVRFCSADGQPPAAEPLELRVTSSKDQSDAWLMVLVR